MFLPSRKRNERQSQLYVSLTARVSPEVKQHLDRLSYEKDISVNGVMNLALEAFIRSELAVRKEG